MKYTNRQTAETPTLTESLYGLSMSVSVFLFLWSLSLFLSGGEGDTNCVYLSFLVNIDTVSPMAGWLVVRPCFSFLFSFFLFPFFPISPLLCGVRR